MANDVLFSAKECPCLTLLVMTPVLKCLQGMLAKTMFCLFETTS